MVAQKQIPRHTEAKKKGSWSSAGKGSWDFINEEDQMYILYVCEGGKFHDFTKVKELAWINGVISLQRALKARQKVCIL